MKSHSIEKFLDFLIPLGAIKSQWRQIKLVAKLYGVFRQPLQIFVVIDSGAGIFEHQQQPSQIMATRWQEIELMQPSFQSLFGSVLQPKSPGCLAEPSRI
jgi:hypothetical protein